jgi:hypothetical protein
LRRRTNRYVVNVHKYKCGGEGEGGGERRRTSISISFTPVMCVVRAVLGFIFGFRIVTRDKKKKKKNEIDTLTTIAPGSSNDDGSLSIPFLLGYDQVLEWPDRPDQYEPGQYGQS